jgi:DNA-binding transcriptional ArsR family regulator
MPRREDRESELDQDHGSPRLSSAEIFDLLGHPVRLAILQELATHRRIYWQNAGLPFNDLRRAVEIRDGGNFNYHLDKLCEYFVTKNEKTDEYQVTNAGLEIADALLAGRYSGHRETHSGPIPWFSCPYCKEVVSATYDQQTIQLECDDHGSIFGTTLPPSAAEGRSMEEMVRLALWDAQQDIDRAHEGICFHCWGRMNESLVTDQPIHHPQTDEVIAEQAYPSGSEQIVVVFDCERCGTVFWIPPGGCLVHHPAVMSFYHDHGIDLRDRPTPDATPIGSSGCKVEITDPIRVQFETRLDDEELRITLDKQVNVVSVERSEFSE